MRFIYSIYLISFAFVLGAGYNMKAEDVKPGTEKYFKDGSLSEKYVLIHYQKGWAKTDVKSKLRQLPGLSFHWGGSAFFPASEWLLGRLDKHAAPKSYDQWQKIKQQIVEVPFIQAVTPCFQYGDQPPVAVLNDIFLKPKASVAKSEVERVVQSLGGQYKGTHPHLPKVHKAIIPGDADVTPLSFCRQLKDHPSFEYVEPDILFSPVVTGKATNDTLFDKQWHLDNQGTPAQHNGTVDADMDVVEAWSVTTGDSSITIGLLDSGIDTAHNDLRKNLIRNGYDGTDRSKGGYPSDSFPEDAHGTACAGIMAAEANNQIGVAGVAYDCEIVSVRIFYYQDLDVQNLGITPYSTGDWMIDGINWSWQQADVDVISNAWGVPDTLLPILSKIPSGVNDAIDQAVKNGRGNLGLPMLFSTGNEDMSESLWPSRRNNTIAVTATSMCDERKSATSCDGESWWGGNYGEGVDIAAPGVKIPTTDRPGPRGYESGNNKLDFNGTSAACPNAAAVVALMLSVNPDLSLEQIEQIVANTADTVGGYAYDTLKEYGSWSKELGYGRVNAFEAVQRANNVVDVADKPKTDKKPEIRITPNPASEVISISLANWERDEVRIAIYNVTGQQLTELQTWQRHNFSLSIDDHNLTSGMYFIEVSQGSTRQVEKLIIH